MTGDAWLTLAVVAVMLWLLVSGKAPPAPTVFAAMTAVLVLGIVTPQQAFSGFSKSAPITVAALYVVAAAVEATGALEWLTHRTLPGHRDGEDAPATPRELGRFLPGPTLLSAFLNNTTIVAMLSPRLLQWSRRTGRSASWLLMPLSFGAILGGLITTIGTSTNLVVSGLLAESGQRPLGIFEIGAVGLPVAAAGGLLLVLFIPKLLPRRATPGADTRGDGAREFAVEMVVEDGSPLVGISVAEAGLRNLQGVYLVEIERSGHLMGPVGPDQVLEGGDRLTFAGNVARVVDLQSIPGLVAAEHRHFSVLEDGQGRNFYEMVVAAGGSLDGRTLKEAGFRNRYAAAVVAIHRAGEQVAGKLGDVVLRAGDVLLALSDPSLRDRLRDHGDFLVVAPLGSAAASIPKREKARVVELVILALVVVAAAGWFDIVEVALLAAFAMVGLRVLAPYEAREAVDLNVIIMIASSFGVGEAMFTSGLADTVASGLVDSLSGFGDVGILAGVLIATVVLTEMITNNAAAVLMFPVAMAVAAEAGLDPRPFAIAIAVGASASFLTPIGYQTNTMVYGMGGYRFGDFVRVGFPLTALVIVVALVVIPVAWPLS